MNPDLVQYVCNSLKSIMTEKDSIKSFSVFSFHPHIRVSGQDYLSQLRNQAHPS